VWVFTLGDEESSIKADLDFHLVAIAVRSWSQISAPGSEFEARFRVVQPNTAVLDAGPEEGKAASV
jgi:hypothetical protein